MKVKYIPDLNLAISGYRGYIGRHIFERLNGVVSDCDLTDLPSKTTLIHLASKVNDLNIMFSNIEMDTVVIDQCIKKNHHLVYASTNNVYPLGENIDESSTLNYNSCDPYSCSKIASEIILKNLSSCTVTVLRIPDVFGKGQKHGNFFKAIEMAISEQSDFNLYGAGKKIRSYIYVEELVSLFIYIGTERVKQCRYEVFNIGYEENPSLAQISNYVSNLTKLEVLQNTVADEDVSVRTLLINSTLNYTYQYNVYSALKHYVTKLKTGDFCEKRSN